MLVQAALAVLALAALAVATVSLASNSHLHKRYAVEPNPVPVPHSAQALSRGRHIAVIRGCVACHGDDWGGARVINDGAMGIVYGTNLTPGSGRTLTVVDWVRAVRHGIGSDGHPLFIMPSRDYVDLSDQDLGDLIAYATSMPAVSRPVPQVSVGPVARVLLAIGKLTLSAEAIDHGRTGAVAAVNAEESAAYRRYLAQTCSGCHNPNFSGGKIAEGPPNWPPAANLAPGGDLKGWTEADFVRAIRTGRRPDGSAICEVMPRVFAQMTDPELRAIWLFLQALPPAAGKAS
jgi:cytochrome c553